jgi:hypothetical protein
MTATTEKLEANKLAPDYIEQVFNQHNPDKAIIAENDLVVVRLAVRIR